MIKCERGYIDAKGDPSELLADLACIMECMRDKFGNGFIETAVKLTNTDTEELEKMNEKLESRIEEVDEQMRLIAMAGALSCLPKEELEKIRGKLNDNEL
jgi:hypothetical protein